ncbi:1-phosphatidylinositol 4,5-bisphosphate phosphodiesterase delta-4-like isoform X2 [Amphiura filiformis]|uniref:1-phosphatidylinositol 4,5-bisphosphate phosphodiesterase delta-4-like isoform X2 n=1 Tax=Amphiura filiformis TaxID=82378 RepID=UPI003B2212DA
MAGQSQVQETIHQLHEGTDFMKIIEKSSKKYNRKFTLSKDFLYITYSPSKKPPSKARISVEDIREIRQGQETDGFKKSKVRNKYPKDNSFSLIVGAESHNINLVAPTPEAAKNWVQGLRWAKKKAQNIDVREKQALWIKETFRKADINQDGKVDFEETVKLLRKMNMIVDKSHAKKVFQTADRTNASSGDKSSDNVLDENEFVEFYRTITERSELRDLFKSYAGEDDYWTPEEFTDFMHKEQKSTEGFHEFAAEQEPAPKKAHRFGRSKPKVDDSNERYEITPKWCESVIDAYEPTEEIRKKKILSYDGFLMFMKGPNGKLFNPFHSTVYQDMKQPLTHYFIASSHNTYLQKDQLRGPSSVEAYIQALQRGCRCVEMDVWDGPDDDPIIYHGHTLTSKIKFKDVVEAVDKYAFEATPYPVILSLENHCSVPQQAVMAKYLKDILGDKLYMQPVRKDGQMPSPEDLKERILIKMQKLPEPTTSEDSAANLTNMETELEGDVSEEDEAADLEVEDEEIKKKMELEKKQSKKRISSTSSISNKSQKKKVKLAKELSDTVVLFKSVGFKGFKYAKENYQFFEMSSLVEGKALDLATKSSSAPDFVEHSKRFFSRIYPAGRRTNSSNYNPVKMWNVGAQIVALNYQTPCTEMDINIGKFQQNGKSGYILKPVFLRKSNMQFNPNKPDDQYTQKLTLRIISGQQFPKPDREVIDPYVKVTLYGVNSEQEYKTSVVDDNGFNPTWDFEENFDVKCPELALLRFAVYDKDVTTDDFIGQYTIPVASIQMGYHHVPLLSANGADLSPASLFVHTLMSAP